MSAMFSSKKSATHKIFSIKIAEGLIFKGSIVETYLFFEPYFG